MRRAAALALLALPTAALAGYADDRAEIKNLSARYFLAMDARDSETYANTFTEDGVLVWAGGTENGRAEIRKSNADWIPHNATIAADQKSRLRTQHNITNEVIEVHGDSATQRAYWVAITNTAPSHAVQVMFMGHYEDDLVRVNGRWLFKKRQIFNESAPNRRALFYPALGERDPRAK